MIQKFNEFKNTNESKKDDNKFDSIEEFQDDNEPSITYDKEDYNLLCELIDKGWNVNIYSNSLNQVDLEQKDKLKYWSAQHENISTIKYSKKGFNTTDECISDLIETLIKI
jgi:hypothetical protein